MDSGGADKSIGEHLHELRSHLVRAGLFWAACTGIAFYFRTSLLSAFAEPVGPLYFLDPAGAFFAYLKLAALAGLFTSVPYILFELGRFLTPAMEAPTRRALSWGLAASLALFYTGAGLGWFLTKRAAVFLLGFASETLKPLVTADQYFGFASLLVLGTGLAFQMPVVVAVLTRAGLLSRDQLAYQWRLATLGSVLAAAFLTPSPDAFTQLLLALPLMGLYWLSVGVAGWIERMEAAKAAKATKEAKLISEPDLTA